MINISHEPVSPGQISTSNRVESEIVSIMSASNKTYNYDSLETLEFELNYRSSLVKSSIDLYNSSFSFKVFEKSTCNPAFWHRTNEGGFRLESGVSPSAAVKDIFINSAMYGTECATAMVIVFLRALALIYPAELFDNMFSDIYLLNWQHLDRDLGISDYYHLEDYLPGDARYFKNPDVNPVTPEWQGENVFYLGGGKYYGHGIGMGDAEMFITELNKNRRRGADTSAYLIDVAKRPRFKYLANKLQ